MALATIPSPYNSPPANTLGFYSPSRVLDDQFFRFDEYIAPFNPNAPIPGQVTKNNWVSIAKQEIKRESERQNYPLNPGQQFKVAASVYKKAFGVEPAGEFVIDRAKTLENAGFTFEGGLPGQQNTRNITNPARAFGEALIEGSVNPTESVARGFNAIGGGVKNVVDSTLFGGATNLLIIGGVGVAAIILLNR